MYLITTGTPDLLTGPKVVFLACTALTAHHLIPSGWLGWLGTVAAQMPLPAPCFPSLGHVWPPRAGDVWRISESPSAPLGSQEPQVGPMGLTAGQLFMGWDTWASLTLGFALLAAPRMHYLADSGECVRLQPSTAGPPWL